jgi:hypothetical protein
VGLESCGQDKYNVRFAHAVLGNMKANERVAFDDGAFAAPERHYQGLGKRTRHEGGFKFGDLHTASDEITAGCDVNSSQHG